MAWRLVITALAAPSFAVRLKDDAVQEPTAEEFMTTTGGIEATQLMTGMNAVMQQAFLDKKSSKSDEALELA